MDNFGGKRMKKVRAILGSPRAEQALTHSKCLILRLSKPRH